MKIFRKILSLIVFSILLLHSIEITVYASPNLPTQKLINVAVFLNNSSTLLSSDIKKSLDDVQKENENKIKFTFFDSKDNQNIEKENIIKELSGHFDLFIVKPVSGNVEETKDTINKIMQKNIALIIYLPPTSKLLANIVESYGKAIIITSDVEQSGTLEGKTLAYAWNANKQILDKNHDNIMQYVMLQGPSNNEATIARTKYSIRALNEAGIKTQQLLSNTCIWDRECARTFIESAFLNLNDRIEAIISNNDEMALGAIEALQKYGFNKGGNSKYIPVVGISGSPEAKKLINQGIMTGTVVEDLRTQANAIYAIGMNLVSGNNPLDGTNFKFDESGITIKVPYSEYVK